MLNHVVSGNRLIKVNKKLLPLPVVNFPWFQAQPGCSMSTLKAISLKMLQCNVCGCSQQQVKSFNIDHRIDYYKVLGVQRSATQKQIKKRFYELSKKLHPDTAAGDSSNSDEFVRMKTAYEVLSNVKIRRQYDQYQKSPTRQTQSFDDWSKWQQQNEPRSTYHNINTMGGFSRKQSGGEDPYKRLRSGGFFFDLSVIIATASGLYYVLKTELNAMNLGFGTNMLRGLLYGTTYNPHAVDPIVQKHHWTQRNPLASDVPLRLKSVTSETFSVNQSERKSKKTETSRKKRKNSKRKKKNSSSRTKAVVGAGAATALTSLEQVKPPTNDSCCFLQGDESKVAANKVEKPFAGEDDHCCKETPSCTNDELLEGITTLKEGSETLSSVVLVQETSLLHEDVEVASREPSLLKINSNKSITTHCDISPVTIDLKDLITW